MRDSCCLSLWFRFSPFCYIEKQQMVNDYYWHKIIIFRMDHCFFSLCNRLMYHNVDTYFFFQLLLYRKWKVLFKECCLVRVSLVDALAWLCALMYNKCWIQSNTTPFWTLLLARGGVCVCIIIYVLLLWLRFWHISVSFSLLSLFFLFHCTCCSLFSSSSVGYYAHNDWIDI